MHCFHKKFCLLIFLILIIFVNELTSNPEWGYFTKWNGLKGNAVFTLAVDNYNFKIISTDSGLYKFDGIYWDKINVDKNKLNYFGINNLVIDKNNNYWFLSNYGVTYYDGINWIKYDSANTHVPLIYVGNLAFDKDNKKWFSTPLGLIIFDGSNWSVLDTSNSDIPNQFLNNIYIDKFDNKWLCSKDSGLIKYAGSKFTVYNKQNSALVGNNAMEFKIDSLGYWWLSILFKGITFFDGMSMFVYDTSSSPLPNNRVYDFVIDSANNKWFGTESGLAKFDGTNWHVFNKDLQIPLLKPRMMAFDKFGNLWMSCVRNSDYTLAVYREGGIIGVTGIEEEAKREVFSIFPNPASNYISLNLPPEYLTSQIKIYSVEGILVYCDLINRRVNPTVDDTQLTIDVSSFSPGVYYIMVGDRVLRFIKL